MDEELLIQFLDYKWNNKKTQEESECGENTKPGEYGAIGIRKSLHSDCKWLSCSISKQPESPCITLPSFKKLKLVHGQTG